MKVKIKIESNQIVSIEEDSTELLDIVRKKGIAIPSVHLGFFKTVYARIESPNLNGIRLAKKAVVDGISGLIGSQANFEHLGAGFVMGTILDAWIDGEEIKVVYSMFKSLYPDEYERSIELAKEGKLSVSFELMSEKDTQENLEDGTIRLNDIDFVGMGHLMDNPPAEPTAKISEFAKRTQERLSQISNVKDRELVCASAVAKACDEVLADGHGDDEEKMPELFIVTTSDDRHFHVAEMDFDGNGITISGHGEGKHPEPHRIVNWQVQVAKNADPETGEHAHRIMNDIMAKIKEYVKVRGDKWTSDIFNNFPDSSFAVIEPAYLEGKTGNRKARHLPFKDRFGRFDLTNYRIALDKVDEILPVTDSITTEELRKKAKEELDQFTDISKANKNEKGVKFMTKEDEIKVKALRDEFGDLAKDVKDEELLDEAKVAELRKAKEATDANAETKSETENKTETKADKDKEAGDGDTEGEEDGDAEAEGDDTGDSESEGDAEGSESKANQEKTDSEKVKEIEGRIEELEKTLEAKDSEIETVRENAEKIGKMKVQLKNNEFTKDFSDEDYLNDEKINEAIQNQENKEVIATRKEELKDNEYAKDFKDEDYLNDDKVENVKLKQENEDLQAGKENHNASDESNDEDDPEMNTGEAEAKGKQSNYEEVMASIRQETSKPRSQKVYTRQK